MKTQGSIDRLSASLAPRRPGGRLEVAVAAVREAGKDPGAAEDGVLGLGAGRGLAEEHDSDVVDYCEIAA